MVAAILGTPPDGPAPYRYPLLIAALLFIPSVRALSATRETRPRQVQEQATEASRAPYGLIALIGPVVLLRFAGQGATGTFFNVHLDADIHTSTAPIGALSAARALLSVPAALIAPLLVARWGNGRTIVLGSLGSALSILPLVFIPHWAAAGLGCMGAPFRIFSQEVVPPA